MLQRAEFVSTETDDFESADHRFDQLSIALHWVTVFLIVIQFVTIWAHEAVAHQSKLAVELLSLHRLAGLLTWFVTAARLAWRHYFAPAPAFPSSMPPFQQIAAKANEYGLYVLLLTMPVTGLMRVLLRGKPFDLLFWHVPALLQPNPDWRSVFADTHEIGATLLMLLIALHATAALFHHLVLRDGVLQRMLPRIPEKPKLMSVLERFQAKWMPVRVKKTRQNKSLELRF
jgi:cytochrome b561